MFTTSPKSTTATLQSLQSALGEGDYARVFTILDENYAEIMGEDSAGQIVEIADEIPDELLKENLWINVAGAVACEMKRDYAKQAPYIDNALTFRDSDKFKELEGKPHHNTAECSIAAMEMMRELHAGHHEQAAALGKSALDYLEERQHRSRAEILCLTGMAFWAEGNVETAYRCWRASSNYAMLAGWTYSLCLMQFGTALTRYEKNQLSDALEICQRVFAICTQGGVAILASAYAHLLAARIHYERNELDSALEEVRLTQETMPESFDKVLFLDVETALAHLSLATGNKEEATQRANSCMARFAWMNEKLGLEGARSMMASIWIQAGMPRMAADCLDEYWGFELQEFADGDSSGSLDSGLRNGDFRNVWRATPLLQYARMRIHEGKTDGIMNLLTMIQTAVGEHGRERLLLQTLVLKATCAYSENNEIAALEYLSQSLALSQAEDCIRVYVDEGDAMRDLLQLARRKRLLNKFLSKVLRVLNEGNDGKGGLEAGFGEHFTAREMEIMQLVVDGDTNEEISKKLFLGMSTVKNHIHSIYQKLGVRNRPEAIAIINQQGLLK